MTNDTETATLFSNPFDEGPSFLHQIPQWFFIVEVAMYTMVGIKITYSTIVLYRKSQDWMQVKEMFTKPTIQSSIHFCLNSALKVRLLVFVLALADQITPVAFMALMLLPMIPLFYAYCLIIVFWMEIFHIKANAEPVERLRKFHKFFYVLSSVISIFLLASIGLLLVDHYIWNHSYFAVIHKICTYTIGSFWAVMAIVFKVYLVLSQRRFKKNVEGNEGTNTMRKLTMVVVSTAIGSDTMIVGSLGLILMNRAQSTTELLIYIFMYTCGMEIVTSLCFMRLLNVPMHFMEYFRKQEKKPWYEL